MAKTAALYARIDPAVKEDAERIFSRLGISSSSAISLFYTQVIQHRGLPFEVKLAAHTMPSLSDLTDEQLDSRLIASHEERLAGKVTPANEAFARMNAELGL